MVPSRISGAMYLLVPCLGLILVMSTRPENNDILPWSVNRSLTHMHLSLCTIWSSCIIPVDPMWRTARPKSEIQQVQLSFTKIFLLFRSLWAIPGLIWEPKQVDNYTGNNYFGTKSSWSVHVSTCLYIHMQMMQTVCNWVYKTLCLHAWERQL